MGFKNKATLVFLTISIFSILFICTNFIAVGAGHRHDVSGQTKYCDAEHPHHTYRVCKICRAKVYDGGTYVKSNCSQCNKNMKPCSHNGAKFTDSAHPHPVYCRLCNARVSTSSKVSGCSLCNTHTHDVSGQTQYCNAEHDHKTYRVCKTCRAKVYDGGRKVKDNCSICHPELQCSHTGAKYIDPNHPHPVYCRTCSKKLSDSSIIATCPICSPAPTESKIGIRIKSSLTTIDSSGVLSIDKWGDTISITATAGGVRIKSIQVTGIQRLSSSSAYCSFKVINKDQIGIYQVKVTTELGTTLDVSVTIKYQVKATASIKYRTKGIQVQNIEVNRMPYKSGVNRYVPLIGASSISESTQMDLARSNITENDGRTYFFKGSLVLEVYNSETNKVLGSYNVARDWQKLCSDYKWGANTLVGLDGMKKAEIAYQAPFPVIAKANYIKQYKDGHNQTYKTVTAQNLGCNDFIFPYECKTLRFASELPPSGFYYHGVQWTDKGVTSSSTTSSAYNVTYTKQSGNVVVNFYYKELTGSVTVNVINASTGSPISGANISGSHSGKTDTSGKFFVPDVATGTYSYTASSTGFQSASKSVTTTASMPNGVVTIALTPIQTVGTITVNVIDAQTSEAIGGADITGSHTGTTSSIGQVVFRNVPVGSYSYTATAFGYNSASKSVTTTASSPSATITIYLSTEDIRGDITVNVLDAQSKKPISGANVIGSQNGTTNSSGQIIFKNVPIGTYFYRATAVGYEPSSSQSVTTTNAEPSKTVTILLGDQSGNGRIEISVIDAFTGMPISGATVFGSYNGTTDQDGVVSFNDIAFDTYFFTASATGYEKSSQVYLTVTEEEPILRYTITLLPNGTDPNIPENPDLATIEITVIDFETKKPIQGARQGYHMGFSCTCSSPDAVTDANGKITYTNVPPDVDYIYTFEKAGYKTFVDFSKSYYIPSTPGYKAVHTVELIPVQMKGYIHVLDADTKEPIEGAYVYGVNPKISGRYPDNTRHKAYTPKDGTILWTDYPPIGIPFSWEANRYCYWVEKDGYLRESATIDFTSDPEDSDPKWYPKGTSSGNIQHVYVYLRNSNANITSLDATITPSPTVRAGNPIETRAETRILNGNQYTWQIERVTAQLPDGRVLDLYDTFGSSTLGVWVFPYNEKNERKVYIPANYPNNTKYPIRYTSYDQKGNKMLSIVRYVTVINDDSPPPDSGNMDVVINPSDTMKSGYGITALITTKCASPTRISKVTATAPNGDTVICDFKSGDVGATSIWQLPINPKSPIGARKIYVPVEFPDNKNFTIVFKSYDQNDKVVSTVSKSVLINGNMYEDDFTMDSMG